MNDLMTPWQHYQQDLKLGSILPDPTQEQAMHVLEKLYQQLLRESIRRRAFTKLIRKPQLIKGAYLWGNVGTGKSYLVNNFFASLPFSQKKRLHFHEFMQQVHTQLKTLQGQAEPLKKLAKLWAKDTYVLCLDEFLVKDIADAMILANLLQALFAAGVCLVTTANLPPQDLYQDGLQRERFIPAIKLLQQHVVVLEVDNDMDYRRAVTTVAQNKKLQQYFNSDDLKNNKKLIINERSIACVAYNDASVWFQFTALCATRTGTEDYLAIAKQFKTIILSDLPVLTEQPTDVVLRFINLVDVLYDTHRQLIMPADPVYTGEKLRFEFKRTASRLVEMQSHQYRDTMND